MEKAIPTDRRRTRRHPTARLGRRAACVAAALFAAWAPAPWGLPQVARSVTASTAMVGGSANPSGAAAGAVASSGPTSLLIVGAGYLGRRVASQWMESHPGAQVIGVTQTSTSHDTLRSMGVEPITVDELADAAKAKFPHVVFAVPPRARSGEEPSAYAEKISQAIAHWAGPGVDAAGGFVFTSSAGVHTEDAGGTIDEEGPVGDTPSARAILAAEDQTLRGGGTVLRLAGLYDAERGAHAYWAKMGVVKARPDGLINLVHYDDAASAVVAALERAAGVASAERGGCAEVLLVADGSPVTRAQICEAAHASKLYADKPLPVFEPPGAGAGENYGGKGRGKVLNTNLVRQRLGWAPRWSSFPAYMASL